MKSFNVHSVGKNLNRICELNNESHSILRGRKARRAMDRFRSVKVHFIQTCYCMKGGKVKYHFMTKMLT